MPEYVVDRFYLEAKGELATGWNMNCPWSPKLQTGRQDSPVLWITSPLTPHNQFSQTMSLQICSIHRSLGLNPPPLGHHHLSAIFLVFWNRTSVRTISYMSGNFLCEEYLRKNLIVAFLLFRWDIKFLWAEKKFPNGQSWTKLAGVWRSFRGFWQTCNEGIRKLLKVFEAR